MIGIASAAYYLPPAAKRVKDWCAKHGMTGAQTQALLDSGADRYHHVEDEPLETLASEAIEKLIRDSDVPRDAIDALVLFNTSQCNVLAPPESTVGRLRASAKLTSAIAFSISQQNCVSGIHALRVLEKLFAKHTEWRYAIVVGVDTVLRDELRAIGVSGIHSDAASALLITRDPHAARIVAIETFNDSRLVQGIHEDGRYEENDNYLWSAVSLIKRVVKSAGVKADQIETILPHNTNLPGWLHTLRSLNIPSSKLFAQNFSRIGHAFGSDVAVNIADAGVLRTPGFHLVFSSGIGGCFGSFVIHCGG